MVETTSGERRGWLFVFEGIDGSGKSTQMRRAAATLRARGLPVVELAEPTAGRFGRQIRMLSREGGRRVSPELELDLFIRDRMEDVEQNIRPALERGDIVLLDRYFYSTMAYQGARGLDPEDIRRRNESFACLPDLVLYFRVGVDEAMQRIQRQRAAAADLFERHDELVLVSEVYDDLARRLDFFHTIDASADEDSVARQVIEAMDRTLARGRRPVNMNGIHPRHGDV